MSRVFRRKTKCHVYAYPMSAGIIVLAQKIAHGLKASKIPSPCHLDVREGFLRDCTVLWFFDWSRTDIPDPIERDVDLTDGGEF